MKKMAAILALVLTTSTVYAGPRSDFFLFDQPPISQQKLNRVIEAINAVGVDPSGMEFEVGPSVWGDFDTPTYYGSNGRVACQFKTLGSEPARCVSKSK